MRGFTLVELIVVMAILGVVSTSAVYMLTSANSGFVDTLDREALASEGRFTLEHMARGIRDALPGSVRSSGDCLEYVPVVDVGQYLTLPVASAASTMQVAVFPGALDVNGLRVAVAPANGVYQLTSPASISPVITTGVPDANNEMSVNFAAPHRFAAESAHDRVFFVDQPVSFCQVGTDLWRYSNYGYLSSQPQVADLPSTLPDRALLSEDVSLSHSVIAATLQRRALVQLDLVYDLHNTGQTLSARLQVTNVP